MTPSLTLALNLTKQAGKPSILYDAVGRLVDRTLSLDQVPLTLALALAR